MELASRKQPRNTIDTASAASVTSSLLRAAGKTDLRRRWGEPALDLVIVSDEIGRQGRSDGKDKSERRYQLGTDVV